MTKKFTLSYVLRKKVGPVLILGKNVLGILFIKILIKRCLRLPTTSIEAFFIHVNDTIL